MDETKFSAWLVMMAFTKAPNNLKDTQEALAEMWALLTGSLDDNIVVVSPTLIVAAIVTNKDPNTLIKYGKRDLDKAGVAKTWATRVSPGGQAFHEVKQLEAIAGVVALDAEARNSKIKRSNLKTTVARSSRGYIKR